jgi:hypothetical protein
MKGGGKLMGQHLRCGKSVYMGNLKLDFVDDDI